jgi:hypothetical protein
MLKAPGLTRFEPKFLFVAFIIEVPGIQLTFVTEWVEDIVCQLSFLSPTGVQPGLFSVNTSIYKESRSHLLQKVLDCNKITAQ